MKLMINGAVTLGTLDGANVEIRQAVGDENIFLFGMTADRVLARLREGYDPGQVIEKDDTVRRAIEYMKQGVGGADFSELVHALTRHGGDTYMTLADFTDYHRAQKAVDSAFADHARFNRMSLCNIAGAGIFSSDRSVLEYCENIWNVKSTTK